MSTIFSKAKPAIGTEVAHQGGLWNCWSQAPGVGEWWLLPVDARAKQVFTRERQGKKQGCLLVKARDMEPAISRNLKPLAEQDWEQEELL